MDRSRLLRTKSGIHVSLDFLLDGGEQLRFSPPVAPGPHKLLVYKISRTKDRRPAAYIKIKLGEKKLERWLIVGDRQIIRKHIRQEQKRRVR